MDMYVKQTSRMISTSGVVPVQGRASCPSKNNVRPIFPKRRWCFKSMVLLYRLGHFSREGMKPSPALGKCDQCVKMYAKQTSRMISPSCSRASAGIINSREFSLSYLQTVKANATTKQYRNIFTPFPNIPFRLPKRSVSACETDRFAS